MAKILLTGAAGFIGYHVYQRLSHEHAIVALDSFSRHSNHQIKLDRVADLIGGAIDWDERQQLKNDEHLFYRADISDIDALKQIFADHHFDAVIHLAAITGVRQSISEPAIYEQANVLGFINILECCRLYNVKKIIYASSSSVYGGNKETPFHEDAPIDNLLNFYAVTKRMNELAAENYSTIHHMQAVGLRFFTVYGPWTRPDMATFTFMKNILEGKPITLFNSGNMERDFTYVDDIAESISRVLSKLLQENKPFHAIYNIGEGKPVNLKEYLSILEGKLQKKAVICNAPMNKEEMITTFADCTKLFDFTGFRPATAVEQGLGKTVAWFLKYHHGAS
jgi:UDP-glucuronate 4-epimerase